MHIKRALPVMAAGIMTLLCLPAVAWGGDALVDGPSAVRSIPSTAAAAFARGQAEYEAWLESGAWSDQTPLIADAPHKVLWTTSHRQVRNDYCGPATMATMDHFLRGASDHWSQNTWAAYKYGGAPLWTDASGASMWVMAMGLRNVTGHGYSYSYNNDTTRVYSRTQYGIMKKSRPVAYGTRIIATNWPNYAFDHQGHLMVGRGFDWRYNLIYVDDPYPENAPTPLGRGDEGGDTYGKKTYKKWVVAAGVTASASRQVIY